jgi:hypothetical protein
MGGGALESCRNALGTFQIDSNRPLAGGGRETDESRPCSGGEGHRWRGPREGGVPGAYGGSIGPLVEGRDARERGSPRDPKAAAKGSMATAVLRQSTSVKDLRVSFSESWVMH